jgi:uncharacterized damage-inducible protein DinB
MVMAMVDALLPEFDHEMSVTRKLLERVPEERWDWRPHPKSYTLGELAQHVATIPMWGTVTLTQPEFDAGSAPPAPPVRSRQALLALFDENAKSARTALVGRGDGEFTAPWALKRNGQTIFSMPKSGVWRSFVMSHLIHHRAQLSVYLRMNDVPIPSMYGPSADEAAF